MVVSLSIVWAMVTLPAKMLYLTIQYYTVGTPYLSENTKSALSKTLTIGLYNHFGKAITFGDTKFVYTDANTILKRLAPKLGDLPGYLEQYTEQGEFIGRSFWLTKSLKSKASPIILYIHGGCFAFQMNDYQLESLANVYKVYKEDHGVDLSILLVDYSLTCHGYTYPTQINETCDLYDQLVTDGYTNIILIGDSAGANLAINTLAYLAQKKQAVWPKGTVAISPYLNISSTKNTGSAQRYSSIDTFPYSLAEICGNAYIGGDDFLNKSAMVNIETNADKVNWKENAAIKNGDILVVYGGNEIMADQVASWCDKIGLADKHPQRVVVDLFGTHTAMFVNEMVAYGTLANWKKQFWTNAVLLFVEEKLSA